MKGVFLDAESLTDLNLSELTSLFEQFSIYEQTATNDVVQRIQDAEVVIVNKVQLLREALQSAKKLKLICLVATGKDNVDCAAATELGITVCNCQAYGTDSVVQHVFTAMLALHTNLLAYTKAVDNGKWQQSSQFCLLDFPISDLKGKTLGIIGYGTLGRGVAKIAEAFGMRVLISQRPGSSKPVKGRVAIKQLLKEADVITLHCPLTDDTKNLINEEALSQMKPTAFLINAARGGIVEEAALANALINGTIAGAATDVLTQEPPTDDNPLLAPNIPHLIITPHCAWGSKQARETIVSQTIENIKAFFNKTPIRVVN